MFHPAIELSASCTLLTHLENPPTVAVSPTPTVAKPWIRSSQCFSTAFRRITTLIFTQATPLTRADRHSQACECAVRSRILPSLKHCLESDFPVGSA